MPGRGALGHIDYKNSKIKQYHKLGKTVRTEPTITEIATSGSASGRRTCPCCAARGLGVRQHVSPGLMCPGSGNVIAA
jgi:hypothetical protein